jgi:hypothetical protein
MILPRVADPAGSTRPSCVLDSREHLRWKLDGYLGELVAFLWDDFEVFLSNSKIGGLVGKRSETVRGRLRDLFDRMLLNIID